MPKVFNSIYRTERLLGEGGFGTVFLAREDVSHRLVAIKQLNNEDADRQQAIVHEVQMVSQFNHPNIATYHHHFKEDGLLFLVMEYCAGGSVRDVLKRRKVGPTEALGWVQTLAETLAFVHSKKIIHHDIKPANLLLTETGTIKLSDFGIANLGGGTRPYMSPASLVWNANLDTGARVDIYALGVTLMELLTGQNPFFDKSPAEIQTLHDKGDFPIKFLPGWQQEIILKAINKVPELRFQSMSDFASAIKSKHVPLLPDSEAIRASQIAERAERSLATKKWRRAGSILEFVEGKYPTNVNVLRALGRFYLLQEKIALAKRAFEQAVRLNPRMDVQKDLGWIALALGDYPAAISLLSDHLHRNPSDLEAQNLLLQCFYETDRYDVAISLAQAILDIEPNNPCFASNYYLASLLHEKGRAIPPEELRVDSTNPFIAYNFSVVGEPVETRTWQGAASLKTKLLFTDYRFRKLIPSPLFFFQSAGPKEPRQIDKLIITFGREGYAVNDVKIAGKSDVSRRHCVIVNCRDDVWLYDLNSTGTYVNGERVKGKVPLIGRDFVRIGSKEFTVTADKDRLI